MNLNDPKKRPPTSTLPQPAPAAGSRATPTVPALPMPAVTPGGGRGAGAKPTTSIGTQLGTGIRQGAENASRKVEQGANRVLAVATDAANAFTYGPRILGGMTRDARNGLLGLPPSPNEGQPVAPMTPPTVRELVAKLPMPATGAVPAPPAALGAVPAPGSGPLPPAAAPGVGTTPNTAGGPVQFIDPPKGNVATTFRDRTGATKQLPPGINVTLDANGNQVFTGTAQTVAAAGAQGLGSVGAQRLGGSGIPAIPMPAITGVTTPSPYAAPDAPLALRPNVAGGVPRDELIRRMEHAASGMRGSPSARSAVLGVYAGQLAAKDQVELQDQRGNQAAEQLAQAGTIAGATADQKNRADLNAERLMQGGRERLTTLQGQNAALAKLIEGSRTDATGELPNADLIAKLVEQSAPAPGLIETPEQFQARVRNVMALVGGAAPDLSRPTPSLDAFLAKAKAANPGKSDAELVAYYRANYAR